MRLIDADKLYPDCMAKDGKLAISQSQLANAPTVKQEGGAECISFAKLDNMPMISKKHKGGVK